MAALPFILNLPWMLIGLLIALLSLPRKVIINHAPFAIVIYVKSFWYKTWLPGQKGIRATTLGPIVLLGKTLKNDLEHELIHVDQYRRQPLIHPFLYLYQSLRYGYKNNPYEIEAYTKAGNRYLDK